MSKFKVPLDGQLFELANGRQLVPGEVEELSADEAKENKELLAQAMEDGGLFEIKAAKEGGDK
jgi:hypothetical protein